MLMFVLYVLQIKSYLKKKAYANQFADPYSVPLLYSFHRFFLIGSRIFWSNEFQGYNELLWPDYRHFFFVKIWKPLAFYFIFFHFTLALKSTTFS